MEFKMIFGTEPGQYEVQGGKAVWRPRALAVYPGCRLDGDGLRFIAHEWMKVDLSHAECAQLVAAIQGWLDRNPAHGLAALPEVPPLPEPSPLAPVIPFKT